MKKLIYLSILFLACIASCDNSKNGSKVKSSFAINGLDIAQTSNPCYPTDSCTDSGYQIYAETAIMWEWSWITRFKPDAESKESLNFSRQNIATLKSSVENSEGIRLYYCLISSDTIPSLAMVNIKDCENQYGANENAILFSDPVRGQYFQSRDSLIESSDRWKQYSDSLNPEVHSPVYAYNYSWQELANTLDAIDSTDFFVTFGLRTLSADEYDEFHCEPAKNDQIMGSIVYCNVIYGEDPNNSPQQLFNFARPCPVYCNPN